MNFRSDSLFKRLTEQQRDDLMLFIHGSSEGDVYAQAAERVKSWGVNCSKTAIHDFFKRYSFGWRLERAAATAAFTGESSTFEEEKRKLVGQKIFETVADADCDPKMLVLLRSLEIEADKLKLSERSAKTRFELETNKLKLAERRVTVLENKFEKAKSALGNEKLSPKEREARLKQIFGM